MAQRMDRREWLATAVLGAAGLTLGGCAARGTQARTRPAPGAAGRALVVGRPRTFARVHVARDRVIRTDVGLRPFRPAGFRVEVERLDDKPVIHNYGHGGGGVTLSWGTAALAVEAAAATGHRHFAVLGCGAVGLATARLLQRRGAEVVIYARDLPPRTTSNVAGAQWGPFTVVDPDRRTPAFMEQFVRACRLSYRMFQDLVGDRYGVRWIENYVLSDKPFTQAQAPETEGLVPDARELRPGEHPFPAPYVRRFASMFIETPVYLSALVQDVLLAGGRIEVRDVPDRQAVAALPEPAVINCTGLGSRALFGDDTMMPIKGQLTVLLPQPEVDYLVLAGGLYMFPRRDGILLGGTFERGEWSLEPDAGAIERVLDGHRKLFDAMR
jgi:glycine/D-amino acid oxidase-like deaminating enzyme